MKLPNIITISGLPASGKSTLAKLMAKKYGYQYLHAGSFFRILAKKKKMTLEEFEVYCLKNPKHDLAIDRQMIKFVKTHKKVIYDGHISGRMCKLNQVEALKTWLKVPKAERIKRYAGREKISQKTTREFIEHREKFLKKRYLKLYKINYYQTSVYDLIINGLPLPPTILKNFDKQLKNWQKQQGHQN